MQEYPLRPAHDDTYFIDPEDPDETTRLLYQDRLVTRYTGGIHPERADLADMQDVLDIACGPAGWVLEVAWTYPTIKVQGVDISRSVIDFNREQAESRGLDNATFQVMDVLKPLEFADNSFDLVNARMIGGFMPRTVWPSLIQECVRITRPGGIIRLTEGEFNFSTSAAVMQYYGLIGQAAKKAGLGFSPDGSQYNFAPKLARLLRDAGCQKIGRMAHVLDFSVGEELHHPFSRNYMFFGQLIQPFLLKMGVASQEEIEQLYQQTQIEMLAEDFCGLWFLLTVWGHKPEVEPEP